MQNLKLENESSNFNMGIFGVYDKVAEKVVNIFISCNKPTAVRTFQSAVEQGHIVCSSDFILVYISGLDEKTCQLDPQYPVDNLAVASDFPVQLDKNNAAS